MLIPKGVKPKRIKAGRLEDPIHLRMVALLPCCVCGRAPCQAHHLIGNYGPGGPVRGTGFKAGDNFAIPLCPYHHMDLHLNGDEIEYLLKFGVNGLEIAERLYDQNDFKG